MRPRIRIRIRPLCVCGHSPKDHLDGGPCFVCHSGMGRCPLYTQGRAIIVQDDLEIGRSRHGV